MARAGRSPTDRRKADGASASCRRDVEPPSALPSASLFGDGRARRRSHMHDRRLRSRRHGGRARRATPPSSAGRRLRAQAHRPVPAFYPKADEPEPKRSAVARLFGGGAKDAKARIAQLEYELETERAHSSELGAKLRESEEKLAVAEDRLNLYMERCKRGKRKY